MNPFAIVVTALVAFIVSAVYYIAFAGARAALSPAARAAGRPSLQQIGLELVRTLVLAVVLATLVSFLAIGDWVGAVRLALLLWIGFPVILLSGSVIYESVPPKLAAIHAGDWLIKLLVMVSMLAAWR